MSNANLFRDKIDFMIMELANKELKKDLELSLMLISFKKQNSFDLNNYEARKNHLLKSFENIYFLQSILIDAKNAFDFNSHYAVH